MSKSQKELIDRDAELYGIAFLVDGVRVSPDKVVIKYGAQASAAPEQEPAIYAIHAAGQDVAPDCELAFVDEAMQYDEDCRTALYTHSGTSETEQLRAENVRLKGMVAEWERSLSMRLLTEKQAELMGANQRADAAERKLGEAVGLLRDSSGSLIKLAASLVGTPLRELHGLLDGDKRITRPRVDAAVNFAGERLRDTSYELRKLADALSASAEPAEPKIVTCDRTHGGGQCQDPECWNDVEPAKCPVCSGSCVVATTEKDHNGDAIEMRCPECQPAKGGDGEAQHHD